MRDPRTAELAANLARVDERIAAACAAAGRPREAVTLVAVTKTWPAGDVVRLANLGVRDVGENRYPEVAAKRAAVAVAELRWHFVGQLQRNKCRRIAASVDVVHSVDRPDVLAPLVAGVPAGHRLDVLVQVALGAGEHRGGADPEQVIDLAAAVHGERSLRLRGVMAVAPLGADAWRAFERLQTIAAKVRQEYPDADWVSAGMSGDLEAAIGCGATHVRVGSAVLGNRPP